MHHPVCHTTMQFYVHMVHARLLSVSFSKKIECKSRGRRSRNHFFELVTEKNMLLTDVRFYLLFEVANIFRSKNKFSQTLNTIYQI